MNRLVFFCGILVFAAVTSLCGAAADATSPDAALNDWENLAVNSINRLPARTYAMPLASVEAALTDALEPETPYVKSLNGNWKYIFPVERTRWTVRMEPVAPADVL